MLIFFDKFKKKKIPKSEVTLPIITLLDLQSHTQRVDKPFWFQRREVSYSVVSTSASKVFSWYECSLTWAQDSVGTPISSMEGLAQFSRALPLKLTSNDLYELVIEGYSAR